MSNSEHPSPMHQELVVFEFSYDKTPPLSVTAIHTHASLALFLGGESTVCCGSTYNLRPGDVYLVPEGIPHYVMSAHRPKVLAMAFCSSCLTSPAGQQLVQIYADVSAGESAQRTLEPQEAQRLEWVLRSLQDEMQTVQPFQDLAVEGYLALLVAILSRATPGIKLIEGQAPVSSVSSRALAFIAQQSNQGISLADVARHVHRSTTHTAAVVKAETGKTVVEWITLARLATARQLLLRTDDTIGAIGSRVGFSSPSHFHRTFRRYHSTTPAKWRAIHQAR